MGRTSSESLGAGLRFWGLVVVAREVLGRRGVGGRGVGVQVHAVVGRAGRRGLRDHEHVHGQLAHRWAEAAVLAVAEVLRAARLALLGVALFARACEAASAPRGSASARPPASVREVFEVERAGEVVDHLVAVLVLADGFEVLAQQLREGAVPARRALRAGLCRSC